MSLLLRFGLLFALAGFVLGLVLRRAWPGRLPEVILLSALPWLVHLSYVLFHSFTTYDAVLSGVLVGLLDVGLVALTLRAGPRLYRRDSRRAALVPLLVLAVHFLLLGLWALLGDVSFRTLPNLYFVAATLFVSAGVFSYALPTQGLIRGLVRRR